MNQQTFTSKEDALVDGNPERPTPRHPGVRRRVAAAALGALLVLTASCSSEGTGNSDEAGGGGVRSVQPSSESSTTSDSGEHGQHPAPGEAIDGRPEATVAVTAVDFRFEGLPATIKAGTRLTLSNRSQHELHELVAFRLPDDEKRAVSEILKLSESEVGKLLGVPSTVLLAAPSGPQISAVGDGTLKEPGRYLIMCSIPTGVEPAVYLKAAAESGGEKPDVAGGPPHFVSGMVSELTVTD